MQIDLQCMFQRVLLFVLIFIYMFDVNSKELIALHLKVTRYKVYNYIYIYIYIYIALFNKKSDRVLSKHVCGGQVFDQDCQHTT